VIIENHIFTRGYATHENIAFYDHSWNKFLSYTNIQQISSIYLNDILKGYWYINIVRINDRSSK